MCWITNQKWRTRPRIAKRKIEVWKFYVERSYVNQEELLISPWQRDKIFQNMRHNILVADGLHGKHLYIECSDLFDANGRKRPVLNECGLPQLNDWRIHCGFHSLQKGTVYRKRIPLTKELVIVGGYKYVLHLNETSVAYNVMDPSIYDHHVMVQCFIPAGAEYYLNEDGEYVSNKIIIGDEIPLDNIPLLQL